MDKGKGRMREMEAEAALQPVRVTAANRDQAALLHQLHNLHASREHYQDLKDKLDILERRLDGLTVEPRWSVNVPFGPLAFMPGQLVHTNTITVRVGEDYFVEYSASQAAGVAKRRRIDVQERITQLEARLKQLDPLVGKEMGLPDGWTVNANDEVLNNEGLPICDIQETETISPEPSRPRIIQSSSPASAPRSRTATTSGLSKYAHLIDELEAEDDEEEEERLLAAANAEDAETIHDLPAAYESGSSSSEESDVEPDRAASLAREVKEQHAKPKAEKKSVSFDAGTKEEDAPSRGSSSVRPVREFVKEVEPPKIVEVESTSSDYKIRPSDLQDEEESEEEEESDDENAGYEMSEEEEEDDQSHIDDLLLSRELALEYHKKRFQLSGSDRDMASAVDKEMVAQDSTLLEDGSSSSMRPSRFRAGPLDMGSLVVPNILQQQELKPGDVIEDLPLQGYKYTAEDEKTIDERLAMLKMGSLNVFEPQQAVKPQVAPPIEIPPGPVEPEAKKDAVKDVVAERSQTVEAVKSQTSEKQADMAPQPPKKVSRFKAARAGQS